LDFFRHFCSDGHQKVFGKDFRHTWGSWLIVFGSLSVSGENKGWDQNQNPPKIVFFSQNDPNASQKKI
jgi:hypothetical protein